MSFHRPGLQPKCPFTSRSLAFMGLLRVPPRARRRAGCWRGLDWSLSLFHPSITCRHVAASGTPGRRQHRSCCITTPALALQRVPVSSDLIPLNRANLCGEQMRLWSRTGSKLRIKRGRWKSVRGDALWYNPVGYDAPQLLYETRPSIITIMDANRTLLHLLKTEMETVWSNRLCLDLICCRLPFSCVCRKLFSQRITWKQIYQHVNKYGFGTLRL